MLTLQAEEIRSAVDAALAEDIGSGDVTSLATVPETRFVVAKMRARQSLVVAGLDFAEQSFKSLSDQVKSSRCVKDSDFVQPGQALLEVGGAARAILPAERVALNFVQRLSGVATLTARFVQAIQGTSARILDTRKTTPGWRRLEKYAVACGGGTNHRIGLFDMILIKDNHLVAVQDAKPNPIAAAVHQARSAFPNLKIEVEADTLEQARQAVEARADFILLDNMSCDQLREAVSFTKGRCKLEASGGVTLDTVRSIAETGVDFISVGALTHSAVAVDIGLDFEG